jgi:hypothetical protein
MRESAGQEATCGDMGTKVCQLQSERGREVVVRCPTSRFGRIVRRERPPEATMQGLSQPCQASGWSKKQICGVGVCRFPGELGELRKPPLCFLPALPESRIREP